MLVSFASQEGYLEIILGGSLGEKESPSLISRLNTALIQGKVFQDVCYSCILWNTKDVTGLSEGAFSTIVGCVAHLRLLKMPSVIVFPVRSSVLFTEELGIGHLLPHAFGKSQAVQLMVQASSRDYPLEFLTFLVNRQLLTSLQLDQINTLHTKCAGSLSHGQILVEMGALTCEALLSAYSCYRLMKQKAVETPKSQPITAPAAPSAHKSTRPMMLGELLVDMGLITPADLKFALDLQKNERKRFKLGDYLVQLGLVTDAQLFEALRQQSGPREPQSPTSGPEHTGRKRLGEILVELEIISRNDLERALVEQQASETREKLGEVLIRLGLVTREQILVALLKQARHRTGPWNSE